MNSKVMRISQKIESESRGFLIKDLLLVYQNVWQAQVEKSVQNTKRARFSTGTVEKWELPTKSYSKYWQKPTLTIQITESRQK